LFEEESLFKRYSKDLERTAPKMKMPIPWRLADKKLNKNISGMKRRGNV